MVPFMVSTSCNRELVVSHGQLKSATSTGSSLGTTEKLLHLDSFSYSLEMAPLSLTLEAFLLKAKATGL